MNQHRLISQMMKAAPGGQLPAGALVHLSMDESPGTIVVPDSSGNGNNAQLYNIDENTCWVPGHGGQNCLDFVGNPDNWQCSWVTGGEFFNIDPPVTYCFRVLPKADVLQTIFANTDPATQFYYFIIYIGEGSSGAIDDELVSIAFRNAGTAHGSAAVEPDRAGFFDGTWKSIVCRNDGVKWEVFVGQTKYQVTDYGDPMGNNHRTGGSPVPRIGARYLTPSYGVPFDDRIQDFIFFNRALTDQEAFDFTAMTG